MFLQCLSECANKHMTHLQVAILIDKNVWWFEITMDYTCWVCIFETSLCRIYAKTKVGESQLRASELLKRILFKPER